MFALPSLGRILGILVFAIFFNEFGGYLWHRLAAHWGYAGDTIRKTHYEHHEVWYPFHDMEEETYRIKGMFEGDSWPWFVPVVAIGIIYLFLAYRGMILKSTCAILIGWMLVHIYLISYIHDSYHIKGHWLTQYDWYRRNKVLHNLHHYFNCNYGISNYFYDWVFGTLVTEYKEGQKEDLFQGFVYTEPKINFKRNHKIFTIHEPV